MVGVGGAVLSHICIYEWVPVASGHYEGATVLARVCRWCR
jgi:hypothetical protein